MEAEKSEDQVERERGRLKSSVKRLLVVLHKRTRERYGWWDWS